MQVAKQDDSVVFQEVGDVGGRPGSRLIVHGAFSSINLNTILSNVRLLPRALRGRHAAHSRSVSMI